MGPHNSDKNGNLPELYELKDVPINLSMQKIKKSIFSIDTSNISQLFPLDKLVSVQGL
jgi:hypothetical protein